MCQHSQLLTQAVWMFECLNFECLNLSPTKDESERTPVTATSLISKKGLSSRNVSQVYNLKLENLIWISLTGWSKFSVLIWFGSTVTKLLAGWNGKTSTHNLIFVVPSIMLYSSEMSPTRRNNWFFILRNGFTLHVSGDNLTHHQEYICCIWPQVSRLT